MIIEREVDCGELYERARREVIAIARSLGHEELSMLVPATPAWTVHDAVAHLVGIAADLNALRFGDGDAEAWTTEQVRSRRGTSIADLAGEWDREAPTFEEGLRLLGYEIGSHYVGDLLQHAQDVRSTLGIERIRDDDVLVVALDFYLDFFHQALIATAAGSVTLRLADDRWTLGSGSVVASLETSRFEMFRTLGGRRSEAQIRALPFTGDVERILPYLHAYPLPQSDVIEP